MIRYALTCEKNHSFESWFQSGAAFDALVASAHVQCPVCGSVAVSKSLMSPALRGSDESDRKSNAVRGETTALSPADPRVAEAIAAMRREVEKNSEYVGMGFAAEARAIHEGESDHRSIWGEARPEDARKLLEDGIAVAPLPFMPSRKMN